MRIKLTLTALALLTIVGAAGWNAYQPSSSQANTDVLGEETTAPSPDATETPIPTTTSSPSPTPTPTTTVHESTIHEEDENTEVNITNRSSQTGNDTNSNHGSTTVNINGKKTESRW